MVKPPALSRHDQILLNALGFIVALTVEDKRLPMMIEVIAEILPQAEAHSALTDALHAACREVLVAWPSRNRPGQHANWAYAMLRAQSACAAVFYWRAGMALDALRATVASADQTPVTIGA